MKNTDKEMVIVEKEKFNTSLTYTPFENIGELLKQASEKSKKEDKE